jgi:hypothetical protein
MPASRSWGNTRHGGSVFSRKAKSNGMHRSNEALGLYRNPLYKDSTGSTGAGLVGVWKAMAGLGLQSPRLEYR